MNRMKACFPANRISLAVRGALLLMCVSPALASAQAIDMSDEVKELVYPTSFFDLGAHRRRRIVDQVRRVQRSQRIRPLCARELRSTRRQRLRNGGGHDPHRCERHRPRYELAQSRHQYQRSGPMEFRCRLRPVAPLHDGRLSDPLSGRDRNELLSVAAELRRHQHDDEHRRQDRLAIADADAARAVPQRRRLQRSRHHDGQRRLHVQQGMELPVQVPAPRPVGREADRRRNRRLQPEQFRRIQLWRAAHLDPDESDRLQYRHVQSVVELGRTAGLGDARLLRLAVPRQRQRTVLVESVRFRRQRHGSRAAAGHAAERRIPDQHAEHAAEQ